MTVKVPKWESELWSYVGGGNGMSCPIYSYCQSRQKGGWCPDDNKERLNYMFNNNHYSFNACRYDFIKCDTHCRIFDMVELLAQEYLKRGKASSPPVPTELVSLADKYHNIEIRLLPLKAYHGAIWHLGEDWIIQIRNDESLAEKRRTLFHEAFHILAHGGTTPAFRKRWVIQGSFNELLADYFAICILIPRAWIKEIRVEVKDVRKIAKTFAAPKSAVWFRLKQLCLI